VAREVRLAGFIEGALEPVNEGVDFLLRGLEIARRRHLPPLQFAYGLLENFGVRGDGAGVELTEK
jgi:hypothetical protein